jgi:glycosyltransferase involved in cell wall biosynthesis
LSVRVLHGTYEIAGQGMVLAEGLRRIGVDARSFAYRVDWDGRVPDEVVDLDALGFGARQAAKREAFARLAPAYDVFHFHFGTSFEWTPLPFGLPFLRQLDVPRLKRMGKRVVMHFHGCEVRNKQLMRARHPGAATCAECDPFCKPIEQRFFLDRARKYADRVFYSTLDLGESVPFGVQLPLAIDAAHWEAAGDAADASLTAAAGGGAPPRDGVHGPVVIAHAPTQRLIKGTRYVEAAVEELRATFPRLELRMFERVPWADMPQALAQCDLLVDQLFMGWYGLLAIEGMSVGRPVVCAMRPDFARTVPDCSVVDASPATLAAVLAPLVADPALRHDLGRRGRAYARAHHDAEVVARILRTHYAEILAP